MPADSLIKTGLGNMEHKRFHFYPSEIKAVSEKESTFEGFSAGIGNEDSGRDIIMPGAFAKSIKERVASGRVKLLDQHSSYSTQDLWGKVVEAEERLTSKADRVTLAALLKVDKEDAPTHRLWSKFFVSQKQAAQEALGDVRDEILDGLSIGYRTVRTEFIADEDSEEDAEFAWLFGKGTRLIHELAWWETSLVIWGMNLAALVIPSSVKSMLDRITRLDVDAPGTVNEKEVRYAIRALHDLLSDEEEARMAVSKAEYTALIEKIDQALEVASKVSSTETVELLESAANGVSNTLTPDGVDASSSTVVLGGFGEILEDIKTAVENLAEDVEEEIVEEKEEELDDETKDPPGDEEVAGDTDDTEAKEDDGPPEDGDGHSDKRSIEDEEKKDEDDIDYNPMLTRLRLMELSNQGA